MSYSYEIPQYEAVFPADLTLGQQTAYPVVVVGGGLVGLTAALSLAIRGIPVVVLDDDDTVGAKGMASRGVCYAYHSLRIFDRLGIYERMRERAATWNTGRVFRGNTELYSFELPSSDSDAYPPFLNLQQFYVEQFLVERLADFGLAEIRWRNAVRDVRPANNHVVLSVETPRGEYEMIASWVIAADGAHSTVRDKLGIVAEAKGNDDTWLIVDLHVDCQLPNERWVWIENQHNENRAVWFHGMADNVWRLDCQLGDVGDRRIAFDESMATALVRPMLQSIVPEAADTFELAWVGPWTYRTYVLPDFRSGRIFFAGDAAHLKSPFGARGGNSGIQDAENLAWKLALVLTGDAPESLLATYNTERREAALENVRVTTNTSRYLFPENEFERGLRQATMELAQSNPFVRPMVNAGRMSVANVYSPSAAILADTHDESGLSGEVAPGRIALDGPLLIVGDRTTLWQLGEDRFLLLYFVVGQNQNGLFADSVRSALGTLRGGTPPIDIVLVTRKAFHDRDFPVVVDADGDLHRVYGAGDDVAYIVRPDKYVAWRRTNPTADALSRSMTRVVSGTQPNTIEKSHDRSGQSVNQPNEAAPAELVTIPNLDDPDALYAELVRLNQTLGETESHLFMQRLSLTLANHIGDASILKSALAVSSQVASEHQN